MAWETLRAFIDDKIRDKLPIKISADLDHNPTLNEIVDVFGQDYIYSGITGKTLQPFNDDNRRMYFTDGSVGNYLFFKDELGDVLSVEEGEFVIFTGVNNVWVKRTIYNNGTFLTLPDTPSSFIGAAGNEVRVNDTGTALEFVNTSKFTPTLESEINASTAITQVMAVQGDGISADSVTTPLLVVGDSEYEDSTTIDDAGFPTFWGTAVNYQSVSVSMLEAKTLGIKDPDLVQYKDNGAGSTGVYAYTFDASSEEELLFSIDVPRQYQENTDVGVNFNWVSAEDGAAGLNVAWGIEYAWSNRGELFGNTSTAIADDRVPLDAQVTQDTLYRTEVSSIDGTGKDINSTLLCRVFRDASSGLDTFTADAFLLSVDFHFVCNSIGSRNEQSKGVSTP